MANIINITEKNNRLEFSDTYTPIVCGNSNYVLKFNFGEQWQNCNRKAAFFVIDGNKQTVDFEGDECKVPVLPNAAFVFVSLVSGEGENQLATTPIRIRLEPTMAGGDFSEFNQLTNYLPKILSALNAIENGEVVAKNAESATTAKVASNVVNPNLLINGDFRVNQRGQTTYSASGYTVDRWNIGANASLTVGDGSITITTTGATSFGQKIEGTFAMLAGKSLCLSARINGKVYEASGKVPEDKPSATTGETVIINKRIEENNINGYLKFVWLNSSSNFRAYFYYSAAQTIKFDYVKLEVGETATAHSPRPYAEELSLCQRYYFRFSASQTYTNMGLCGTSWAATNFASSIAMPQQLRNYPTITMSGAFRIAHNNSTEDVISILRSSYDLQQIGLNFAVSTGKSWSTGFLQSNNDNKAYIEFDSEIY